MSIDGKKPTAHPPDDPAPMASLEGLVGQIAAGDRVAFEELYRRTSTKLFGACVRILPDRQEAEDALQATYLAVWRNAARFDRMRGTPMTWLLTVTHNCAVDRLRARRTVANSPIEDAIDIGDPAPDAGERLGLSQDARRLHDCLDRPDMAHAALVRKAFFEGITYAELATRSGTPLGTLKSRIRRALLKLRDCLE